MKSKRFLLIDDDGIITMVHRATIMAVFPDAIIEEIPSAKQALEYFSNRTPKDMPDIMFLDINMPVMNGFQVLENILKINHAIKDRCKIYMLTSSVNPEDKKEAQRFSIEDFVSKPLSTSYLRNNLLFDE